MVSPKKDDRDQMRKNELRQISPRFVGRWEIQSSELWSEDLLHELGAAHMELKSNGTGHIKFLQVVASLDCRSNEIGGTDSIEFSWQGKDAGREACGRGQLVIEGAELRGQFFFHQGDDSAFVARRAPIEPKCANSPAETIFSELAEIPKKVNPERDLDFLEALLVRDPKTRKPVWEAYFPFVGPLYESGGVMVLSTAQNLSGDVNRPTWPLITGLPNSPHYRLYRCGNETLQRIHKVDEVNYQDIEIAPWKDGVLPALVGLAMRESGLGEFSDLNEICRRVAISNFFKHSLTTNKGNDLNPLSADLADPIRSQFHSATAKLYVNPEIQALKPKLLIVFKDLVGLLKPMAPEARVIGVNDPSWMKQGMGGVASPPNGSWYRRVSSATIPPDVETLISTYISQMATVYKSKSEAVRIYLLYYWLEMTSSGTS